MKITETIYRGIVGDTFIKDQHTTCNINDDHVLCNCVNAPIIQAYLCLYRIPDTTAHNRFVSNTKRQSGCVRMFVPGHKLNKMDITCH